MRWFLAKLTKGKVSVLYVTSPFLVAMRVATGEVHTEIKSLNTKNVLNC